MENGFTLTEVLVVVSILFILAVFCFFGFSQLQKRADLENTFSNLLWTLKLARSETLASKGTSQWGVFFSTSTGSFTLFSGSSYASRNVSLDSVVYLPERVEFSKIDNAEIVFQRLTGMTQNQGEVWLRLKNSPALEKKIVVEFSGNIQQDSFSIATDSERLKDSRRVQVNYSRAIDTSTEKIVLSFEGGSIFEVPFLGNLSGSELYFADEFDVSGSQQYIFIHTLGLGTSNVSFCIHRDRRYNNKSVDFDVDGDTSYPASKPTLVRFDASGNTFKGNSIFVSEPVWQ